MNILDLNLNLGARLSCADEGTSVGMPPTP